jgi:predicted methyltransferase/DNA-directed RNA polymerase subunit RPC12/RpoP
LTREELIGDVAATVGLVEGEAGVHNLVRAVARLEPVAVRKLSRATDLPVPFVSAICNELRKRGVVSRERPVRLTPRGRALFGAAGRPRARSAACPGCARREIVVDATLAPIVRRLTVLTEEAPKPRVELDQVHCTIETKLRRVLAMDEAGALDGKRVLLLGDDDLTSIALRLMAERLDLRVEAVVVLDVDPALVAFLRRALRGAPFRVECAVHDLREPLPAKLRGAADAVFTDPPYTSEGAALFLSRAAEATGCAPGRDVFLAFGSSRPDTALAVQRSIVESGFTIRRLVRNFNEYRGAGILGGTSHLYELVTTRDVRALVAGAYRGPLYTGDFREPARPYRCKGCGLELRVGRGRRWTTIAALRDARCPRCGGESFGPLPRSGGGG